MPHITISTARSVQRSVAICRHDENLTAGKRGEQNFDIECVDSLKLFVFVCPDRYVLFSNEIFEILNDKNHTSLKRYSLIKIWIHLNI